MTALGYGIEMFGDAFGPGMSTRVVGSGKVNYNSSNVYYSPGGDYSAPGYIVKDLTGSSGRPITQPGTEYAWKVGTIPDGAGGKSIDYDFYPNGPEEVRAGTRTTTIQDPSKPYQNITVPVYEPSEGRTLRDYAEQELPGHVSIDRENTSVVIPPLYSQEPATARFAYNYEIPETVFVRNVLGRVKVSENMSPIPKTRFILDYNYFDEAPITNGQAGVNRLTPGLEWAFLKDIASLEVRIPVGWTVNSRQSVDGLGNEDIGTIGDVTFYLKMLHCKTKRFALSSGMGVSLPTGKDRALADSEFPSRNFLEIENKSVHLMPFVGLLYTPDDTFFSQLFAQCDVNACSDDVLFYDYVNTGSMQRFAKWHEGFYVYISGMVGRWLYKDFSKRHGINGLNVSAEVHWTQSLGTMRNIKGSFVSPDGLSSESITIYRRRTEEYLNLTLGTHLLVNQRNNIGFGFCVPLFNQKQFDFETRITFSHHF